jgi:VWFA-related protein
MTTLPKLSPVLGLLLFVPVLSAQDLPTLRKSSPPPEQRQEDTPKFQVEVKEVTLPVTVRDKHGKIVQTLSKDDFTLVQDGKPQSITNFRRDTNLPLTLGLLVDTSYSERNELDAEKTASEKFLDDMLAQPKDQAFLIHFDREVELMSDLTPSKDKLHKGISELQSAGPQEEDRSRDDDGQRAHRRNGTQLYDAIYLAATEVLQKPQGRKAVIILSDGQDRGSKETLSDAVEAAQRADASVYAIYFKGEEEQRRGWGNDRGGRMGGPRIGFPGGGGGYPGGGGGYPGGSRYPREEREPRVDGKKILTEIATKTGGQMFEVTKKENVEAIYAQIAEELRSQYMLAYTPDKSSGEPGYHRVTVAAKDKDMKVQTREGFYISEATTAASK